MVSDRQRIEMQRTAQVFAISDGPIEPVRLAANKVEDALKSGFGVVVEIGEVAERGDIGLAQDVVEFWGVWVGRAAVGVVDGSQGVGFFGQADAGVADDQRMSSVPLCSLPSRLRTGSDARIPAHRAAAGSHAAVSSSRCRGRGAASRSSNRKSRSASSSMTFQSCRSGPAHRACSETDLDGLGPVRFSLPGGIEGLCLGVEFAEVRTIAYAALAGRVVTARAAGALDWSASARWQSARRTSMRVVPQPACKGMTPKNKKPALVAGSCLRIGERRRIELPTFALRTRRSPS